MNADTWRLSLFLDGETPSPAGRDVVLRLEARDDIERRQTAKPDPSSRGAMA